MVLFEKLGKATKFVGESPASLLFNDLNGDH